MKSKEEFVQFFSKFVVCVCAHMSVYVCVCVLWGDCIDCKQENNVVTTIAITSLDVLSLEHQELKETRLACCFSVVRSHPISKYCWECEHGILTGGGMENQLNQLTSVSEEVYF